MMSLSVQLLLIQTTLVLIATENGFGKRSPIEEYRLQNRGGKGVRGIKRSARNGDVIAAKQVDDEEEVILIADSGKIIRMDLSTIQSYWTKYSRSKTH